VRYVGRVYDSVRWEGFDPRPDDIIISTPPKCGTTWTQMICALLVFQTSDLPAPLWRLSPWLDWLGTPRSEVDAQLSAQEHRRFVKSHTPLDGLPLDERATYIVVGRHPLDMAVSLYHQGDNLDRERIRHLTGQPASSGTPPTRPSLRDSLLSWIDNPDSPHEHMDSLPGVMWHLSDAWARRSEPNVVLVHYDDLSADLEGEMRRLATLLGIDVADELWPQLVEAARFASMQARADQLAPDPGGVLVQRERFFRRGSSGAGREVLSRREVAHYRARTEAMAPPDLLAWLHREDPPT